MECAFVNRFGLTEVQSVTEYLRSVVVESPLALPTEELAGEIGKWLGNAKNAHSVSLLVSHNSFFQRGNIATLLSCVWCPVTHDA